MEPHRPLPEVACPPTLTSHPLGLSRETHGPSVGPSYTGGLRTLWQASSCHPLRRQSLHCACDSPSASIPELRFTAGSAARASRLTPLVQPCLPPPSLALTSAEVPGPQPACLWIGPWILTPLGRGRRAGGEQEQL